MLGQTNHHLDLVSSSLLAKDLGTVKGMAYLFGHILGPQPKTSPLGKDLEIHLLLARLKSIINIFHTGEEGEGRRQLLARLLQDRQIPVAQLDGEGRSTPRSSCVRFE